MNEMTEKELVTQCKMVLKIVELSKNKEEIEKNLHEVFEDLLEKEKETKKEA